MREFIAMFFVIAPTVLVFLILWKLIGIEYYLKQIFYSFNINFKNITNNTNNKKSNNND